MKVCAPRDENPKHHTPQSRGTTHWKRHPNKDSLQPGCKAPSAQHPLLAHLRGVVGAQHLFFDVRQTPRRGPSWHRGTRPLKTYLLISDALGEKSRSKGGSVKINDKDFNQDRNREGLEEEFSCPVSVAKALQEELYGGNSPSASSAPLCRSPLPMAAHARLQSLLFSQINIFCCKKTSSRSDAFLDPQWMPATRQYRTLDVLWFFSIHMYL